MLRAGVTEIVHGDGDGDGADALPSCLDEDSPLYSVDCVAGGDDNLSIDFETLFNFLDNEQPDSSSILGDCPKVNQIEGNAHEKASLPQNGISGDLLALCPEIKELQHSQHTPLGSLDVPNFKEGNGLMLPCDPSGCHNSFNMFNQSYENVKPYDSHLMESSSNINHPSSWLSLSTSVCEDYLMDSIGCSIFPSVSVSLDDQQLQTQIPESLASDVAPYKSILAGTCSQHANSIHMGSRKRQEPEHGEHNALQEVTAVSCDDGTYISSSNHSQQVQGIDSTHLMSLEAHSFSSVQDGVLVNSILIAGRMNEGTCPTAVDSSSDQSSNSHYVPSEELSNNSKVAEMTWKTLCNSPVTMNSSRECRSESSAKNTSRQFLPGQLSQSFTSIDRKDMIDGKDKEDQDCVPSDICTSHEAKPCFQQETFSDCLFDPSLVDSDSSLSEMSCNGIDHMDGMNFQHMSNADSLQVCFSKNYTSDNFRHVADSSEKSLPESHTFIQNKKRKVYFENSKQDPLYVLPRKQHHFAVGVNQALPKNLPEHSANVDEDPDICVIDDTNNLNHLPPPEALKKSHTVLPPPYGFSDLYHSRASSSRFQADDEKLTFQIALQDLAQPKSEANPPEGVLAVPLLRHQRIALAWMVQKETLNLHCSGGILADDQGLGKTVSTIALILMERSPSSKSCTTPAKGEYEALNLDEDDELADSGGLKKGNSNMQTIWGPLKGENAPVPQKGRPAAGTLVVCPTSVLRQWADELKNKVTSKANLSFLVYHGSNRTRDPFELVKYDVVLTTYSIVSMEVPTRSVVDKSDVGKRRPMGTSMEFSAGKKGEDSQRILKDMNTGDSSLPESTARPLARVGWFRVILDEAQTIKNHRTQVARACWGLRAKRRWCLSGTPIQNAVDDLYSYFRFLRYDPFAVYNSFCSKIKIPINRDPAVGYRKLQAVLKTIMLRRTKGTLLDGKPIINLPPKTIMLKKVDFSIEERAFYSKLEAESREKFKGYADAGTVKQNYVNILLMLLRLRQACDHPLLVKGCDSSSIWRSSLETAKKIPRDKQIELLNYLETCLALCAICNDPPEDAVVAICGHVFCNQCISEHLTGDNGHCPSANCKVKITGASVFSKTTLQSGLSSGQDCPESVEMAELHEPNMFSDSSKIKAAVEILQSLPTHNDPGFSSCHMADDECTSTKNLHGSASNICLNDKKYELCPNSAKCSNALVSEKAIVYSQWTRMLDLLEARLNSSSIQYRRLDGTMSVVARDKAVKDFNSLPEVTVMIMSLKAASLGLNMVSACHVLLLDLWWNPTTEDQAIDRAHRIGQTRPVMVSRLTVENTVEDRILALQEKKREMVASAFGEDESRRGQTRLTVDDLRYLFRV